MEGETAPSASMSEDEAREQLAQYLEDRIDVDKDGMIVGQRNLTAREFAACVRSKEPWTQRYVQGWIRQEAECAMDPAFTPSGESFWQRGIRYANYILGRANIDGKRYER